MIVSPGALGTDSPRQSQRRQLTAGKELRQRERIRLSPTKLPPLCSRRSAEPSAGPAPVELWGPSLLSARARHPTPPLDGGIHMTALFALRRRRGRRGRRWSASSGLYVAPASRCITLPPRADKLRLHYVYFKSG